MPGRQRWTSWSLVDDGPQLAHSEWGKSINTKTSKEHMILYDKQGWSMSLQKLLLGEIMAIVDNQINKAIF